MGLERGDGGIWKEPPHMSSKEPDVCSHVGHAQRPSDAAKQVRHGKEQVVAPDVRLA
jgi:hypothetical protein